LACGAATDHHVGHARVDLEGANFHWSIQDALWMNQVCESPHQDAIVSASAFTLMILACHCNGSLHKTAAFWKHCRIKKEQNTKEQIEHKEAIGPSG
jgi:hypothetical protein